MVVAGSKIVVVGATVLAMSGGAGTVDVGIASVPPASEPASIVNCQAASGVKGIGADTAMILVGVWA